jgi:membrane protease YdiL (CAAX protease family)
VWLFWTGATRAFCARDLAVTPRQRIVLLESLVIFLIALQLFPAIVILSLRWSPWVAYAFLPLTLLWAPFRGFGGADALRVLGLHRGRGVAREAALGVLGYVAGVPVIIVGFVTAIVLVHFSGDTPSHPIVQKLGQRGPAELLAIGFAAVVLAPVLEEIFFRGAFYGHLRKGHSALLAGLLSALVFAAVHPQGLAMVPVLGAIGFVLALLREWRGSLIAAIVAHAGNNAFTLSLAYLLLA